MDEAREIAKQAYLYGFPMVEAYKTLYAQAVETDGPTLVDVISQPLQDARAPVSEWVA